jgi:carbon-monoxide dehydrogenase medium subunit
MAVPGPVRTSSSLSAAESMWEGTYNRPREEELQLKAPSFAYAKPRSLEEAFPLLERPGARILAGGQSLIPSLNMRLSSPQLLVDIGGLSRLRDISQQPGGLRIGALVTHAEIERSLDVNFHVPLLAAAAPHIAHPAIRNRGTLGGSLALADPAAEYPACALALNATIVLVGRRGERRVPAAGFFKGLFETEIRPGEILVAAEFPKVARSAFLELTRRHGDYAIVGLAGVADASGKRLAFFSVDSKPVLAKHAAGAKSLEEAMKLLRQDLSPAADLYNTSATKLHLAGVLLSRAWNTLSKPH